MGEARGRAQRFLGGDALRALAALAVLLFHLSVGAAVRTGDLSPHFSASYGDVGGGILTSLNVGLFVFFALSGYLVGGPFARAWVQGEALPGLARFAEHRIRRIVPACWVFVAFLVVRHGMSGASTGEIAAVFGFQQTMFPSPFDQFAPQLWTLDLEAAFYVALPIVALGVAWLTRRRLLFATRTPAARRVILTVVLLAAAVLSLRLRGTSEPLGRTAQSLPALLCAFVPGILLATLEAPLRDRLAGSRAGRGLSLAIVAATVLVFAVLTRTDQTSNGRLIVLQVLIGGGVVAAPLVWQWTTGAAWRPLVSPVMTALGRWSYGIYLWHVAVLFEAFDIVDPGRYSVGGTVLVLLVPVTAGSVLLGALSWRLIERPLVARRSRPQPEPEPVPVPARVGELAVGDASA